MGKTISVIIPVFNEHANILQLYQELIDVFETDLARYSLEIYFMDNHSSDNSFEVIRGLSERDKRVRAVRLSRNFGYQTNIMTGYLNAVGDAVVQLDADGEDDPRIIKQFIEQWEKGYKVVYGIRKTRKESWFLSLQRKVFYRAVQVLYPFPVPLDAGDFRLLDRAVVEHLKNFSEANAYLRGLISYIGFEQIGIPYDRRPRYSGKSKFNYWQYLGLAWDGITSFSRKPLMLCAWLGFIMSAMSFIGVIFYFWFHFFVGTNLPGFTTLILVQFFLAGIQLLSIGLIGTYIGRIFDEVKRRPQGIVETTV